MKVFEYQWVNGQSMGSNYSSPSQQMTFMINACVQAVYTGSPNGSLKLQVSNDNVNFTDYPNSSVSITQAGSSIWLLENIGFPYIMIIYTSSSGTGTLNVTINGKGV